MNLLRAQAITSSIRVALSLFILTMPLLAAGDLWAQSASASGATASSAQAESASASQSALPTHSDELAQMQADLNRLESLLGNMSAEIEFLHDQNLQILLRSNAQMWTILIRDLKRHLDHEQQRRNSGTSPGAPPSANPR